MARRSLADQAKLEALRIAELCRLFHRDAAVRARLEDVLILERRANIAAVRNIKAPSPDAPQRYGAQTGKGRRRGGRGRRRYDSNRGADSAGSDAATHGDATTSSTTTMEQAGDKPPEHPVELPELTPPSMEVEAPPAHVPPAAAPVVPEQAPPKLQPPQQEPPQQRIPPRRSLQLQLSQVAVESTPAAPPRPPPQPPPQPPEQPWQTPTKKGKARRKEPQQSCCDPYNKLQEPPAATPRKHKTPKKPENASWELARKQNRATSFKNGAASAMLEADDFYDDL